MWKGWRESVGRTQGGLGWRVWKGWREGGLEWRVHGKDGGRVWKG